MKRVLLGVVLILLIALAACGNDKIHEDVDESLSKDARQIMERIIANVEEGISIEDVSEDDHRIFGSYTEKYIESRNIFNPTYEGANATIEAMASGSLVSYSKGISLESDKIELKESQKLMEKSITTGKAAGE